MLQLMENTSLKGKICEEYKEADNNTLEMFFIDQFVDGIRWLKTKQTL